MGGGEIKSLREEVGRLKQQILSVQQDSYVARLPVKEDQGA